MMETNIPWSEGVEKSTRAIFARESGSEDEEDDEPNEGEEGNGSQRRDDLRSRARILRVAGGRADVLVIALILMMCEWMWSSKRLREQLTVVL